MLRPYYFLANDYSPLQFNVSTTNLETEIALGNFEKLFQTQKLYNQKSRNQKSRNPFTFHSLLNLTIEHFCAFDEAFEVVANGYAPRASRRASVDEVAHF